MTDFITENEFSQGEETMNNFDEMINSNKKTKADAKSKKTNAEIIEVTPDVQVEIDKLLKAKKAKKVAESDIKKAEPKIIDFGIELKDENAFDGKFQKSYKLGTHDSHVNMVTSNKFSFKEEDAPKIKRIISDNGGDADKMLPCNKDVKLKAEVFKEGDLQERFFRMVGEQFPEFFETIESHSVCEDFDKKIYDLGEGAFEDLKVYIKQSKPSLR